MTNHTTETTEDLPPVVCTASGPNLAARLNQWPDLVSVATEVTQLDDGAQIVLPASYLSQVESLKAQESECCKFLDIDIDSQPDHSMTVRITSANPDAMPIIKLMAGLPTP